MQALWTSVDQFISGLLIPSDPALDAALEASAVAELPLSASPANDQTGWLHRREAGQRAQDSGNRNARRLQHDLARAGAAGGWQADHARSRRQHAQVARANFVRARLAEVIDLRLGPALETLPRLAAEGAGPFDLIFIDADKPNTSAYFDWALSLSRAGSLIIVDNVVRDGEIADAVSTDANVQAMRRFLTRLAAESAVEAAMQTVGSKGYDGLAMVRRVSS